VTRTPHHSDGSPDRPPRPLTVHGQRHHRPLRADGGRERDRGESAGDERGATGPAAAHARSVADALAGYDPVVEVGIGRRTDVAARLHDRGTRVVAVDRRAVETPDGVCLLRDDVTDPRLGAYPDAEAVYALNLPPDLHAPVVDLARALGADLAFTTLGTDPTAVRTTPESVAGGTLHWVCGRGERD